MSVITVIDYRLKTIKRQTMAVYDSFGYRSKTVSARLNSAAYRLYARSFCNTKSFAVAAVCGFWRHISVICLWLVFHRNVTKINDTMCAKLYG